MFRKNLSGVVVACGVLTIAGLHLTPHQGCPGARMPGLTSASAGEKKGDKPALSGAWAKKGAELTIEFKKNVLKIAPHGDDAMIAIVCDYTLEKGGLVKAKVTGFEANEEVKKKLQDHAPVGLQFSFQWTVDRAAAKLDKVTGDKIDTVKSHLEGDYGKK